MKADRSTATIVGVLFIIGTVSGILSAVFTGSILVLQRKVALDKIG